MRILLIEDDSITARNIQELLKTEHIICETTDMGEDGLAIGKLYEYDLILLDLQLPDIDGHDVLKRFRMNNVKTPVLILSGVGEMEDKIKALGYGADDYITKPFNKKELVARIHAIIRRSRGYSESQIKVGRLMINLRDRCATIDGKTLHLTSKEYSILELLVLRKGNTLTKEMFLNHLYDGIDEPEVKIIDVFICKLRRKLGVALGKTNNYIETVWGRGYVLRDPKDDFSPRTSPFTTSMMSKDMTAGG